MTLTANIRYEKLANAFENFKGYFAETPEQIRQSFKLALETTDKPSIINIAINPSADRKAQVINISFLIVATLFQNVLIWVFILFKRNSHG